MKRAYKYRLYPNKTQADQLDFLLWQGRKIYNGALAMRKEAWEQRQVSISLYDLRDYWCAQRKVEPETLGLLPRATVDDLIRRLDKAYQAFFRRMKASETLGFPRFKGRWQFNSLGYANGNGVKFWSMGERWAKVRLMNVGEIRARYHRPLPEQATIKMAVIKRDKTGRWWISLQIEIPDTEAPQHPGPMVGIDIGLLSLLALSNGATIDNPRWLREMLREKRVLNRKLSRQVERSTRWYQTKKAIAKLDGQIAQKRDHFWHEKTTELTQEYSLIALEDLPLDFMFQNKHLALSASDAGLGSFRQMLDYKAEQTGTAIYYVPPRNTSQLCSGCGAMVPKSLNVRTHRCVSCGLEIDRDVNAARNILQLAVNGTYTARRGAIEANGSQMPCAVSHAEPVATRARQ